MKIAYVKSIGGFSFSDRVRRLLPLSHGSLRDATLWAMRDASGRFRIERQGNVCMCDG